MFKEGFRALEHIGLLDFLYSSRTAADGTVNTIYEWYPTSDEPRFSLIPLILGTLMTAMPATIVSTIFCVAAGIYLSEVANPKWKEFLKPLIELFAGIPTVVIGFIMLVIGASFFNDLLHPDNRLNAFVASIGLSFVIIPVIASLTEDAPAPVVAPNTWLVPLPVALTTSLAVSTIRSVAFIPDDTPVSVAFPTGMIDRY
mgnify:CR=1 FL=1